jgi:hypothetical protein
MTGYDNNGIIRNNSNELKITNKLLKAGLRDPGDTSQAHTLVFSTGWVLGIIWGTCRSTTNKEVSF